MMVGSIASASLREVVGSSSGRHSDFQQYILWSALGYNAQAIQDTPGAHATRPVSPINQLVSQPMGPVRIQAP